MGRDGLFDVFSEVGVDGRHGVRWQECDAFGDLAAHRLDWAKNRNRLGVPLDNHLRSALHASQDGPDVFRQVTVANV